MSGPVTLDGRTPPMPLLGWVSVVAAAVVLFWVEVPLLLALYDMHLALAFALATVQCGTLPLVVRLPRTAIALQLASLVTIGSVARHDLDHFWPVPVPSLLVLTAMLVLLGLRERWWVAVGTWWLGFLAMTVTVLVGGADPGGDGWGVDVLVCVTVTLVALAVSLALGQRRRTRAIVASARRDVELEQARRATVEERARIARELHDVVAHSMSLVHIQAESARYRVTDLTSAQREFVEIARSARAAMGEMRSLLGALRPGDDEVETRPQPSIADVAALVATTKRVGSPVIYRNEVVPGTTSPVVELTAYRIVQEALSNVRRHAPNARVGVELRSALGSVTVRVINDPPPQPPPRGPERLAGGHGLQGMRERVALLGGEIIQRRLPSGGFEVQATFPTSQDRT